MASSQYKALEIGVDEQLEVECQGVTKESPLSKKEGGGSRSLGSPQVESLESNLCFFQDASDSSSCGMGVPSVEVHEMPQINIVDS